MCSLVPVIYGVLRSERVLERERERDTDFVIEELSVTEQVVTEGELPIFNDWKVWNTPRISIFCAQPLQLIKQWSLFVWNTPEKYRLLCGSLLDSVWNSHCEDHLWGGAVGYVVFWPSHFAFVALMNLLLWKRQILHFNYGLLENLQNLLQQSDEFQEGTGGNLNQLDFFIMTLVKKKKLSKRWIRRTG